VALFKACKGREQDRQERSDAAEHRRRILAAARSLFSAHGVDAVSMNQIAREAGVGPGTLYRRYEHKGDLSMELLRDSLQRFQEDAAPYLEPDPASGPALEHLDAFLARLVSFTEENAPLLGAINDAACGDRRTTQYHSPVYAWLYDSLVHLLQRAVLDGSVRSLDVPFTADALLAASSIDLYLFQRRERGFSPERIMDGLRRLYSAKSGASCSSAYRWEARELA